MYSIRDRLESAISFTECANDGTTPNQLLDAYRAEILREAAEKIRDHHAEMGFGEDDICHEADLIDPDKEE